MIYYIDIFHEDGHNTSQSRQLSQLYSCTKHHQDIKIKWVSGHSCPKNWIGYTEENPSPGRDIRSQRWKVECDEETMVVIVLKTNAVISHIGEHA